MTRKHIIRLRLIIALLVILSGSLIGASLSIEREEKKKKYQYWEQQVTTIQNKINLTSNMKEAFFLKKELQQELKHAKLMKKFSYTLLDAVGSEILDNSRQKHVAEEKIIKAEIKRLHYRKTIRKNLKAGIMISKMQEAVKPSITIVKPSVASVPNLKIIVIQHHTKIVKTVKRKIKTKKKRRWQRRRKIKAKYVKGEPLNRYTTRRVILYDLNWNKVGMVQEGFAVQIVSLSKKYVKIKSPYNFHHGNCLYFIKRKYLTAKANKAILWQMQRHLEKTLRDDKINTWRINKLSGN